jgi:hypothetical protein
VDDREQVMMQTKHFLRSSPSSTRIEAAREAVDIQHLTRKKQSLHYAALHGFEIHLLQTHAAAGDKLLLELPLSLNEKPVPGQIL